MPRKQVLKPATPRQVIEFYQTADEAAIAVVADVAQGIFEARFPRKTGDLQAQPKPKRARRPRAAQTESLSEA